MFNNNVKCDYSVIRNDRFDKNSIIKWVDYFVLFKINRNVNRCTYWPSVISKLFLKPRIILVNNYLKK